jgi:amino acid adenylation domain-containing protein
MEKLVHLTDLSNLPLSSNQQRLWILWQQNKSDPSYNISMAYHIEGEVDQVIMRESVNRFFRKHHTLFSVFKQKNGVPYITIDSCQVPVEYVDFSARNCQNARDSILSFYGEQSRIPFDLEKGPLFRVFLIKETEKSYFFCMTVHHIVFDGFSRRLFVQEFSRIYSNLKTGIDEAIEPPKFQSYDFAALEKTTKAAGNEDQLIEFWKRKLNDCPPELKFPYDSQRTGDPSGFGCRERVSISPEISRKIIALSKESNSSVFKVLLSALSIFFTRYTGVNDICIGIPVSNRRLSPSFKTIGFFVDTLPVRLIVDEGNNFRKHIHYSTDEFGEFVNNSLPYDRIVEALKPERIPGLNPFFQVCFSWINNFTIPLDLGGIVGKRITVPEGVASFDITFSMWENGDCIEGEIEYNTDVLEKETIIRLKKNFLNLISVLAENPEKAISSVSMISDEEIKMIEEINNTTTDYPREKTIACIFEEQSVIYPDKKAVVFKNSSLSYNQLNIRSNQLARVLRNTGIKAKDRVAILADKSVNMIVGILGILKAGGVYVPLDPEYPAERKTFVLNDSGCRVLVTQDKYMTEDYEGVVMLSLDSSASFDTDGSDIEKINGPSDPAYVIYTSGTTGLPKGSLITQRGVVRLVCNTNYASFTAEDRILQTASIVFDASTEEIFGALLNGATLYIVDKETLLNTDELGEVLIKNNITIADIASALFAQIAEIRTDIFRNLKYLILGGDVLSAPHVNKVRKNNPHLIVVNGYGPTENACNSTAYTIEKDFDRNIPIGKPISNSTAYIFDKYMNYQPVGIIGELYVGGDGVSPGYLNREDLNRNSFVSHPFRPQERLYRTGDYARWLPDGNIEFHGRIDNQLKIRGFRVELDEIESILAGIEGVIDAVVKPINSGENDIRLIAFLDVPEAFTLDEKEIIKHLKSKLPFYMIPHAIKLMHGFPLTINGKTDRKALKYEDIVVENKSAESDTFLTPIEERIHEIWSKILRINETGRNNSFFESGGNSLLAISLINRLEEEFCIDISYRDLILNSTIAGLGKFVEEHSSVTRQTESLIHLKEMDFLPLSQSQARIWIITRLNPSVPGYIIPFIYRLSGQLNIDVFRRSINTLFLRHHVLFSRINEKDGVPYSTIQETEVEIELTDYSNFPSGEAESMIREFVTGDSRRIFDLVNGPLFRLHLFKSADDLHYFYFAVHHIIFDGWSWKVFINDLNQIYDDLENGREISLIKLDYQQYDFANWEKQSTLIKDDSRLVNFWKDQLEGCSSQLNFPYDYPRLQKSSGFGDKVWIKLPSGLSSGLRQLSKSEGSSLFATMMSIFGILMSKYSGDTDLNVGTPVANRSLTYSENVVGMFVNTVVIRFRFDQEKTFTKTVKRTNDVILDAISNQDLQFEKIVEIVNPERLSGANPVFQVAFGWEDNLNVPLNLGKVTGEHLPFNGGTSPFDLTCSMFDNGENIEGTLIYNTDLIKKETAERLCNNFVNLASNLLSGKEMPVLSVPMISDEEKQIILSFTDTKRPYPDNKTIIQLFEEQVVNNPDKIAVVFHEFSYTYDQLNRKSNQLARTIREKAVITRDTPVGILVDRSADLIVGILGILKSGGAYLPIDPDYPSQRIDYMINDSGCGIILTQGKYMNMDFKDIVKIDLNSPATYGQEDSKVENNSAPEDLAYIMYTSGTTGGPKGSMIKQKSIIRLVKNTNYIDITESDRILLTGAIVFDASTFEIWGMLLNGGSLYIVEKEIILDPNALGNELITHNITILWLTSALFTYMAESRTDIFRKLKYLFTGGDVISAPHINKVRKENPELKLINAYGPTENTTFSTCFEINRDYDHNIPIGRPISNSTTYIFDKYLNYQPIGVKGELYVGGDGVSRGYLNREELNKLSFIGHPYIKGERIYKTGDYARWLPDGNIEFLGRIDNQVKIRGFRIEMEEIETALSEFEGIVEAVVKPVKLDGNDVRLVAFLDAPSEVSINFDEVNKLLLKKLPPYMLPSAYKIVHGFPMTINGKIDRKSLTIDLSEITDEQKKADQEKLTGTQQKVLKIWQEVIKNPSVRVNDNFFYVGGNSLLALVVVDKIEKEFNVGLDLRIFFDSPVIKSIAEFIDYKSNSAIIPGSKERQEKINSTERIINGEL